MLKPHTTAEASDTVFCVLYSLDGLQALNVSSGALENYSGANDDLAKYATALTDPLGFGAKEGDWPAAPDGDYRVTYYVQAGAGAIAHDGEPIDEWAQVRKSGATWTLIAGNLDTQTISGGTGGSVVVTPILTSVKTFKAASSTTGGVEEDLDIFQNAQVVLQFGPVLDGSGEPIDLTGHSMAFGRHDEEGANAVWVEADGISLLASDPTNNPNRKDTVQYVLSPTFLATVDVYTYKAWDLTLKAVLGSGKLVVKPAPLPS